jgi:trigger factor
MHVQKTSVTPTHIKLQLQADPELLQLIKQQTLKRFQREMKLPGFRMGKVPAELVEKNADPQALQNEFLDNAMNRMYGQALTEENIRPVSQPDVTLTKFVPFTTLEFDAEVDVVGEIKLPDYTRISVPKKSVKVEKADIDEVLDNLRLRAADKKEVERAAKEKDEVWIDFAGRDAGTGKPIQGADGKDYPLVLGSNTFIPGFEAHLMGAKAGEKREFTIEFPANYGVKSLQGRKATFEATVTKVNEVVLPKIDDSFAASVGPFKTAEELKSDIRSQLISEREYQNSREYESELLAKITEKSDVAVPDALIEEELNRLEQEERQNLIYRGQTWEEHLEAEGVDEAQHRAQNRSGAEQRVRAGLVLAEIAEKEKIEVMPEEFEMHLQMSKGQYKDEAMRAELDKPENRRELASRLLSEKTIQLLVGFADKAAPKSGAGAGSSTNKAANGKTTKPKG